MPTDSADRVSTSPKQTRYTGIDALRGIAAMVVVFYHLTFMYHVKYGFPQPIPFLFHGGPYAVSLFFIISGFVILISAERAATAMDFTRSRAMRLYPAYWICLLISFASLKLIAISGWAVSWARFFLNITMFEQFFGIGPVVGTYWSLTIELAFYLWIAFLLAFRKLHFLPTLLMSFMLIGAVRQLVSPMPPTWDDHQSHWVHLVEYLLLMRYIPFFAAGTALYLITNGRRWSGTLLVSTSLVYLLLISHNPAQDATITIGLFAMVAAAVCFQLRWLSNRVFLFLGAISYPLYLIHIQPGFSIIWDLLQIGVNSYVAVGLAIGISILLASLVTFGMERKLIQLIKRPKSGNNLPKG